MGCVTSNSMQANNPKVECVVCFDEANTVIYPCGHYCLCNNCAMQISENDKDRLGDLVYMKINIRRNNGLFCPCCRKLGLASKIFPNLEPDFNTI